MKRKKRERMEREAIRDVARLMLAWSARLPATSKLGKGLEKEAEKSLRILQAER